MVVVSKTYKKPGDDLVYQAPPLGVLIHKCKNPVEIAGSLPIAVTGVKAWKLKHRCLSTRDSEISNS